MYITSSVGHIVCSFLALLGGTQICWAVHHLALKHCFHGLAQLQVAYFVTNHTSLVLHHWVQLVTLCLIGIMVGSMVLPFYLVFILFQWLCV